MTRGSKILTAAAVLVVLGAAAFLLFPRSRLPDNLLQATPRDAAAIFDVRVARLLQSKAFDQLVSQRGHDRGMREITEVCGDNPLAHVDEALIFALPPQSTEAPPWGALLRGDLDPRALAECVKKTLEKRGKTSQLRQDDVGEVPCLLSSDGNSRACALWDGLVVGSDVAVRAALTTMTNGAESVLSRPAMVALWDTLDESADARGVVRVPESTQRLLTGLVRPFLPEKLAPITRLTGGAGELFAGESVRGEVNLQAADNKDAEALTGEAQRILARMRDSPLLALTPARALLEQTSVTAVEDVVRFRGDYPLHALGTAFDMLPAAQQVFQQPTAAPRPPPVAKPSPDPVETDPDGTDPDESGSDEPAETTP